MLWDVLNKRFSGLIFMCSLKRRLTCLIQCVEFERERASMCVKGGFSSENIPQFHAPRWVTGWLSWESTSEGLIGRTGFGEHKRYLIPSVEWGSALIWVLISSTYSIEEWTGTMLCLRYVPSYIKIAIYFALWFKCFCDSNMGLWFSRWVCLYLQSWAYYMCLCCV